MPSSSGNDLPASDATADETQDDVATAEPLETQDSPVETYTDVTLDDIDRENLDPQMQSAYDNLVGRDAERQAHFTQRTQQAAQAIKDAESWQSVISNPQLARVLNDAVYKMEHGIPLDQQDAPAEQTAEIPDSETDPEGYINHLISTQMEAAFAKHLPGLQNQMQEVTGFVRGNQAALEFDNLAVKYPAVKAIGLAAIQRVQQGHTDASGRPISMEKAVAIMSLDNPSITQAATSARGNVVGKKPARVEESRTSRASSSAPLDATQPVGIAALQKRVLELGKDMALGLKDAGKRAYGVMSKLGTTE